MAITYLTKLKPEPMGAHSLSTAYGVNSLVMSEDGAAAYISVKDVPAGTPLTNTEYWMPHTDLSAVKQSAEALKSDLERLAICKNIVGVKANELYPCYIPNGSYVTFSSSDGSAIYCLIKFYDKDKKYIEYWSLDNKATRTIEYNVEDAYYVSVDRVTSVPIQVEIGSKKSDFVQYFGNPKYNSEKLDALEQKLSNYPIISDIGNQLEVSSSAFSEKLIGVGSKTEKFMFFSDVHPYYNGNLSRYDEFMAFVQKIAYKCDIDIVIDGGDWLQDGDSAPNATSKLLEIDGRCKRLFNSCYHTIGNHDTNYQGISENKLSNNTLTSIWFEKYGHNYYEFNGNNTTFIVLDSGTDWDTALTDYRKEQIDWLCNKLNAINGNVAIIIHIWTNDGSIHPFANEISKILVANKNKHEYGIGGKTYSFSNSNANVRFVLAGHEHQDYSSPVGSTTIPVISIINAINSNYSVDGCIVDYDNNKLYTIRFGNGDNREFTI